VNAGTALRWFLLSWDWGPCRRYTSRASTPGSRSSRRTGVARRRFLFRPRGFAPPRRLSPRGSCGSVAPRNRQRVHRVSRMPAGWRPEGQLDAGDGPRGAFRTLRRVPLVSSRTRITAAVAFLSSPSCPAGGRPKPVFADRTPTEAGGVRPRPAHRAAPRLRRAEGVHRVPRGGAAVPKSGGRPSTQGGGWFLPCRGGGEPRLRRAGIPGPGGSGRAGLRRVPSPGPGDGRRSSEEPRRPGRAATPKSRHRPVPSGWVRRPEGRGPASMAGVRSLGSGGTGVAGTGRRGSEEPRRRCPE
jgi:hypothetical protein